MAESNFTNAGLNGVLFLNGLRDLTHFRNGGLFLILFIEIKHFVLNLQLSATTYYILRIMFYLDELSPFPGLYLIGILETFSCQEGFLLTHGSYSLVTIRVLSLL